MPKNKGIALVPILIVVALIATLTAGYFFIQNQKFQLSSGVQFATSVTSPTPAPTIKDETANWKTCTSGQYSFSIKYPPPWDTTNCLVINSEKLPDSPRTHGFPGAIIISVEPTSKPKDYIGDGFPADGYKKSEIKIDGVTALKAISLSNSNSEGSYNTFITFAREPYRYHVDIPNKDSAGNHDEVYDQILSTFKFTSRESDITRIVFGNGSGVELQLANNEGEFALKKINNDTFTLSSPPIVSYGISYYKSLPETITKNSFMDSDGNEAATGCYFDKNNTVTIHNLNFNQQICYYNPININTKSGKYDPKTSSPIATSCVYTYTNNEGYIVFKPVGPTPVGTDACDFLSKLKSLNVNSI